MSEKVIEVKNLSIGYNEYRVISDLSFSITEGELVGIIGCNGAGKSTLLKTIRGMLPKQSGEVWFYDKQLEAYSERELARKVAYLQQHVEVGFGYSGLDLVMAGRYPYKEWWQKETDADKRLALECMAYTGTAELAEKPVTEVSGGQKQRILLAKVLAQQTPLLFLDEPTTGLDMVYQEEIFRFAHEFVTMGKTVLMVVHELALAAKYCSRILLLGGGSLLADGTPEAVFTEELLSKAYSADVEVSRNPLNNNLEVTTRVDNTAKEQKDELLKKICGE